jgi:DNA-binding NtrC family response regulator
VSVNVRIIAATNADLRTLVADGAFREDLFYRINVLPMTLPPLRERPDDIVPLAKWFLAKFRVDSARPAERFDDEALELLRTYPWPGNIRELRNCIDRASIICRKPVIGAESLYLHPVGTPASTGGTPAFGVESLVPMRELEDRYIQWALEQFDGNRTRAAEALGLSVRGLRYKLNTGT